MIWLIEISEALLAILPVCFVIAAWRYKNFSPTGWMIKLVGSTFFCLLQIGLLLRRLTATCSMSSPVTCDKSSPIATRVPGIFDFCTYCHTSGTAPVTWFDSLATVCNQYALPMQAAGAVVALIISLVLTVSFTKELRASLKK
jgi:hypothetical protein